MGVPSQIWKHNIPTNNKHFENNISASRTKNQETYIPHNSSPIIPSTHSYPGIERMNIQNIWLPRIQKLNSKPQKQINNSLNLDEKLLDGAEKISDQETRTTSINHIRRYV